MSARRAVAVAVAVLAPLIAAPGQAQVQDPVQTQMPMQTQTQTQTGTQTGTQSRMQTRGPADAPKPEWINGEIPASLTGQPGDPLRGRQMIVNRQAGLCLLCHQGPFPEERFQGTLAPDLSESVARMTPGRLRAQIVDASRFNQNTIMPPYFRTDHLNRVAAPYVGRTLLQAQDIEDVVAFLVTLKP